MDYLNNYKKQILLLLFIPLLFLFRMVFFGEIVTTNDELERHPINEWRDTYLAKNKDIPQWYPNLFSGMPSYGGYIYNNGDPLKEFRNKILFNPGLMIWFYLVIFGLGMFILLRYFEISRYSAAFGALMSSLTPYTFGLIGAGHLNKIFAMSYIPWVFLASVLLINKISLKRILMLSLATALQLWMNHPQVVYYTWMVVGFYYVWKTSLEVIDNKHSIKKSSLTLFSIIFSVVISLAIVSDPYSDIYQFQEESNRGSPSVIDGTNQTKSGTKWEYATQWSFHPKEIITFIYPYHYGLQNHRDINHGAYWGFMPFTQSTHYLGLIIFIFAFLGIIISKPQRNETLLWIITVLIIVTGLGSIVPILYKPFYNYLPLFSKFRVPSMIYLLLSLTIPFLGAKGLDIFLHNYTNNKSIQRSFQFIGFIIIVSCILLIAGKYFVDFNSINDSRYSPLQISRLYVSRVSLFEKGLIIVICLSCTLFGMVWALKEKKIDSKRFQYGIILLSLIDLGIINNEFMDTNPSKNMDRLFRADSQINYLLKDDDFFRVFPADKIGTNKYSYWNIESIGGYRPIKLRNYQDLMDAGGFSKPKILNMLNVKYILTNMKINNPQFTKINEVSGLYENTKVLPKAWIVGKIKNVNSQRESLMEILLSGFNPQNTAVVNNYTDSQLPLYADGEVQVKSRTENMIELVSTSNTGGLLVLSEMYYGPGWKATVNGKEVPIFQTNHILRSVRIPKGNSEIVFEYDISSWKTTKILSRVSFLSLLLALGILFWKDKKK